jgi:arylsulfatase A-like enzyme
VIGLRLPIGELLVDRAYTPTEEMMRLGGLPMPAIVTGLVLGSFVLGACGPDAPISDVARDHPAGLPDVLLISIDTLRADRLGCYGYERAETPFIDGLADEGVLFETTYTTAPITLPAHASMLTGLTPPRHGVRDNGSFRLPESIETVAEVLRDNGYRTGAFIGGVPLERARGLDRGFDVYDDEMPARALGGMEQATRAERTAEEVFDAAADWLATIAADRPAFAFVHLYDPHSPYVQPVPGSTRLGYDGEIAYVDRMLGRFLERLDAGTRSRPRVTIVTSDHGEGLGEHDEDTHCVFAYDSTLHVPWIIHWPGAIEPRRISGPVGIVDIVPTLLDLLGVAPIGAADGPVDGRTRAASVRTGDPVEAQGLYFESLFGQLRFGWAPLRGLREGPWKYIDLPGPELYDLDNDPRETRNLVHERPEIAAGMVERLAAVGTGLQATAEMDPETRRQLTALGYVSAPPAEAANPSDLPDPKDEIRAYEDFQRAHALALEGRIPETLALLSRLEPSLRRSPYFYVEWGNFAAAAGQWPLAIRCYGSCLALDPVHEDALLNLGVSLMKVDRPADARAQLERLLEINPDHVKALLYAGVVAHNEFRDAEAARRHWERFLSLAPTHPQADEIRRALTALNTRP